VPLLEQVLEKYPDKVNLVFKNFPLRNHALARPAAIAALAAGEQGKFWEYHDRLFENYRSITQPLLLEIARELELDMEAFEAARKNHDLNALINRDTKEGSQAGVRGTPTVFINGRRLNQRSLAGFSEVIERELERIGQGKE
jgi:protein-disulfide isomerase